MKILDSYILKKLILIGFSVTFTLTLLISSTEIIKLLSMVSAGKLSIDVFWEFLFLKIIPNFEFILPFVAILAVIITYGNLYMHNEMSIIYAAGISPLHLKLKLAIFSLPVIIFLLILDNYITPKFLIKESEIIDSLQSNISLTNLVPGKFNNVGVANVYIGKMQDNKISDVWIRYDTQKNNKKYTTIVVAKEGEIIREKKNEIISLYSGFSYDLINDDLVEIKEFKNFKSQVPSQTNKKQTNQDIKSKSSVELLQSDNIENQLELHKRIFLPIAFLLFSLFAFKISRVNPRSGGSIYSKVLIGILVYIIFQQILGNTENLILDGTIPISVGYWPLAFILFLYSMQEKF